MNRINYYIPLLTILLCGCISDFKANLPENAEDILVVEGDIIENTDVQFSFSKSYSINDMYPPTGYNDVSVKLYVIGSDGYRSNVATYLGSGVHQVHVGTLDNNASYGIEFEYDGETYHSGMIKPVHTPEIDSLSFKQQSQGSNVSIRVSTHAETSEPTYFMWQYFEDWEFSAKYYVTIFYDADARQYYEDRTAPKYFCWDKDEGHDILIGSTEKLSESRIVNNVLYEREPRGKRFSILYSTRVRQKALSKGAYEYYLDQQKANQEMGGLFSPQPSGIEGNITCTTSPEKRVIGYIDVAKNVVEDTLFISRDQISSFSSLDDCPELTEDSVASLLRELRITKHEFILMGFHPLIESIMPEMISFWTSTKCIDCTLNGGTKDKPVFWPNNHN